VQSKRTLKLAAFLAIISLASHALAQKMSPHPSHRPHHRRAQPWEFNLVTDGYIIPNQQGYANPNLLVDHGVLHLEARYNSENFRTGSAWVGYNFSVGKKLLLEATPIVGGAFGRTNGIAPGCEATLTWKKLQASISSEYVFATNKAHSFYYDWPEVTYAPIDWLKLGLVSQSNKPYQTSFTIQPGFLIGVSHKTSSSPATSSTSRAQNPSVVLELGLSF
jgi:hypothetical protein